VARAQWCTLCYTDLRPPPEPVAQPAPRLAERASAPYVDQVASAGRSPAASVGALPAELADEDRRETEAAAAAQVMLAQLAADSRVPLGGIAGNLHSNAAKAVLIAAGSILVVAVLMGLMMLIGSVLPADWLDAPR
jgi:hypothetical protein